MKSPRNQIDPIAIFRHAETFFESLKILIQSSPPSRQGAVAWPIMVLMSFTAELYFKCLILRDGKPVPLFHQLYDLFKKLSPPTQALLERRWNEIIPLRENMNKRMDMQMGKPVPRDLRSALREGNKGFELIRYLYENREEFRFFLSDLPIALRRTILDLEPTWGKQDTLDLTDKSDPSQATREGDLLREGTIVFALGHEHSNWSTNSDQYVFGPFFQNGVEVSAVKTNDRRLKITLGGALGKIFNFDQPIPAADVSGVTVGISWSNLEIKLYLNGILAKTIKPS